MKVRVEENRRLSADFRRMRIDWPGALSDPLPGQFVMVRTRNSTEPLWRRPFGVHDFSSRGGSASAALLYQVVGPTTRDLAAMAAGQSIDLLGPFGNGFDLGGKEHWLVAGGRGVAPLFFLARRLSEEGRSLRAMIGGCTESHVMQVEELRDIGCPTEVATEDGSLGRRGMVTDLLGSGLESKSDERRKDIVISACGPEGMLRSVSGMASGYAVTARLSLDTLMACGQGYCQGCTVKTRSGYSLCCREGPVFDAEVLAW
jgi:dihydroorotate dehydrogenase electron transfer subunit